MRIHNLNYHENINLYEWMEEHYIPDSALTLIQICTFSNEEDYISRIIAQIKIYAPQASIIGCTSDGEIIDGKIHSNSTLLSFTVFEETFIRSAAIEYKQVSDSFSLGAAITQKLFDQETKVFLLFTDATMTDGQAFLDGVHSIAPNVIVAGGLSANSDMQTMLFTEQEFIREGVVGISLSGSKLLASNQYNFNWKPIGKFFTITHSIGNRVYTVDHVKVLDLYNKYLGTNITTEFLQQSNQFPFILTRDGIELCRAPAALHEDGSVSFHGDFQTGEKVRFSFGDPKQIIEASKQTNRRLFQLPAEAIWVYSCVGRRMFILNSINHDINPLQDIAPTVGFFALGEFYSSQHRNILLNYTTTYLLLSEKQTIPHRVELTPYPEVNNRERLDVLNVISHLTAVSTEELYQLNASLEASEQRYKSLAQNNPDIVYSIDRDGTFVSVNQTFYELLGYEKYEGNTFYDLVDPASLSLSKDVIANAFQGSPQTFEVSLIHQNKKTVPFLITKIPIIVHDEIVGVFGIAKNISDRKKAEKQITYLAYHDALTHLPNRLQLDLHINRLLEHPAEQQPLFAVLFLDLDNFKMFNDTYGHDFGDRLLHLFAEELQRLIQDNGIVARFGGDEFVMILQRIHHPDHIEAFAKQIIQHFKRPLSLDNREFHATTSIGISIYPTDGDNQGDLLRSADLALYRAKQSGKNRHQFFNHYMTNQTIERHKLEFELYKVMERNELQVYYQPLIDVQTNQWIGSEALVRWFHPELGSVAPSVFIPIAEECGMIDDIGYWVLHTACLQNQRWQKEYAVPFIISVNVSSRQFKSANFVEQVFRVLQETGTSPTSLHLEITESTALIDMEYTIQILNELRKSGVSIAMDDFGTGYSSLSYMKDLVIDKLKIDRSFITHLLGNKRNEAIVKTIIDLSHNLNIKVLAEGVETLAQLNKLSEYGCDEVQGFLFSPPLSADEFANKYKQG